ncbi:MAG TPA: sensor domain-containing protein [Streptosporangiaceae bacterium]|nr:sensor domain-containing protein [Streptosporangiaceae bacterium]
MTGPPAAVVRAPFTAPFTGRARRELLFCVLGLPLSLPLPVVGFAVTIWLAQVAGMPPWTADGDPSWLALLTAAAVVVLTAALMVATGLTRALAAAVRGTASKLLGEHVATPPRARTRLGDGPGWRAMAYLMLKLPAGLAEWYVVGVFWVAGVVNLSYPFWWLSFRNHSPGVRLSPVPVITPFTWSGVGGHFQVTTFPGTFAAFGAGVGMLLAAPWVTRAVVAADRWLVRGLLGPGRLTQRVHDLEQTRALAVEDAAARLRRLERDLHDGAQIRLATLAMNLGMASRKLGETGAVPDVAAARELVGAARRCAKDALVELRELARGIHPPVLDNGLADALASLAATSAIPAELVVSVPVRPTPAIETIAYFCAAELLANAAKHSQANMIKILMTERAGFLALRVTDDGLGGADPAGGSGLSGLAQRVAVVDGRLDIASPPGGPTTITVELPLRAGHR